MCTHPEYVRPSKLLNFISARLYFILQLYTSYDTNIGLFVCTSFIIVIEEFQHLLEPSLVALIKESMYNATVGDGYRVGGVNGDGYSAGGFMGDNRASASQPPLVHRKF
jgi:hypothetical protein